MRRVAAAILVVVLVAAGVVGLVSFLSARDSSTFSADQGPGQAFADQGHAHWRPGQARRFRYDSTPPTSGPHVPVLPRADGGPLTVDQLLESLELGDVVLLYGDRAQRPALLRVATRTAGRFDRALVASGQAVVLDYRPGPAGLLAAAWRHLQRLRGPADPRLSTFIQAWLGRGASG